MTSPMTPQDVAAMDQEHMELKDHIDCMIKATTATLRTYTHLTDIDMMSIIVQCNDNETLTLMAAQLITEHAREEIATWG